MLHFGRLNRSKFKENGGVVDRSENSLLCGITVLCCFLIIALLGCYQREIDVQKLIDRPIEEISAFRQSRKYMKNGVTLVYLTGSPYEIGLAHGVLCKEEILKVNGPFHERFKQLSDDLKDKWLWLAKHLERFIPKEYREEIRGIADGADVEYSLILLLNTLTTIGDNLQCFAFSFRDGKTGMKTFRQIDISVDSPIYEDMILYIIKPKEGHGFAAILNPGWVDGESGMNEAGLTVSQNNIGIKQTDFNVMPITILSRQMLQYAGTIDEAEQLLDDQKAYPARLLFVSSPTKASFFELANSQKARIDMKGNQLFMANHASMIRTRRIRKTSVRRLDYVDKFLADEAQVMNIEKALKLVRSYEITFGWIPEVENRQSFIFSPSDLNFWIAIPPDGFRKPASHGPYVGFNLKHELYGLPEKVKPRVFLEKK